MCKEEGKQPQPAGPRQPLSRRSGRPPPAPPKRTSHDTLPCVPDRWLAVEERLGEPRFFRAFLRGRPDPVKVVYHKALSEISLLKKVWLKALSIPAKGEEEEEESTEAKEQVPLSGSPQRFGNSQSPRFYGISKIPSDPQEFLPQKLIPLLQSVLQALQENRKNNLSPESPAESHKRLMKKNQNFLHLLSSSGRRSRAQKAHPGEETVTSLSPSELEDKVDALTEELLQIAEDEEQFLNSKVCFSSPSQRLTKSGGKAMQGLK